MSSLLIKNADYLVTMDKDRRILRHSSLYLEGPQIMEVDSPRKKADRVIDASGMVILPGFINTHLHIPQVFHRHCPAQQNQPIEQWIKITTSINQELDEEAAYHGALICFAELMLSGTTTTLDFFYPFPKGKKRLIEATVRAAKDIGIRFTSIRGSMSLSKKDGALYDEDVVEESGEIIDKSEDFIKHYHDNTEFSMVRVGIGPCLPWASTKNDYQLAVKLARKYKKVILQTHLAESVWENDFIREKYKVSPFKLMENCGFVGPNVSFVHANIGQENDWMILAKTKTNIVICPVCNTRNAADGNGVPPVSQLLKKKINISLGCDGAASNDSQNFLEELRFFRTVTPGREGLFYGDKTLKNQAKFTYYHPLFVYERATLGGAKTLNRDDIGSLEKGKAADLAIFNLKNKLSHAGVLNQWGSLISCQAIKPNYLVINGKVVVEQENIKSINLKEVLTKFQKIQQRIIKTTQKRLRINLIDY